MNIHSASQAAADAPTQLLGAAASIEAHDILHFYSLRCAMDTIYGIQCREMRCAMDTVYILCCEVPTVAAVQYGGYISLVSTLCVNAVCWLCAVKWAP